MDRREARRRARYCGWAGLALLVSGAAAGQETLVPGDAGERPDSVREALHSALDAVPSFAPIDPGSNFAGVREFYAARDYAPAWSNPASVQALAGALRSLDADGLRPENYGADRLETAQLAAAQGGPEAQARFDLDATLYWFSALHDLRYGRVDPGRIEDGAELMRERAPAPGWLDAAEVLSLASASASIEESLQRARPATAFYTRLQTALAEYRSLAAAGGLAQVSKPAASLKPGMSDAAVPSLRRRLLGAEATPPEGSPAERYDDTLVQAVQAFQTQQSMSPDGVVGAATLAALNVSAEQRVDQLRVNLERARWLLQDIPQEFVLVDIAGYRLSHYRDGQRIWMTRVVVGEPYKSTPSLRSAINRVEFNPQWVVPPSIARKEIAPKLASNPNYLAEHDMRVYTLDGTQVAASAVDWSKPYSFRVRQGSGPKNSLGRLVLRFPNAYDVYLHDTPAQALFGSDQRARSHGCIRVQNVRELVRQLLDDPAWDAAAIDAQIDSNQSRTVNLKRPIPVILYYWTVDISGETIGFKDDVYRRDARLLTELDRPAGG